VSGSVIIIRRLTLLKRVLSNWIFDLKLIYLETKNVKKMEELIPWYRHFKGDIEPNGDNKFILYGKYTKINDYTLKITELPPTIITDTYKENVLIGKLLTQNIITENIKDNSDTDVVDITIEFTDKTYLKENKEIEIYKMLKLYKNISCNNFYLFDKDYKIKLYKNANYILQEFIELRLNYYTKQKAYYLEFYNKKILELKNKIRFLEEIMNDILVIYKKTSSQVTEILTINKYDKIENSFSYLRTMQIDSFTKDKLDKLIKEYKENEEKYNELKIKTESQLYKSDLSELYKNA
jgi:DNA topoisomerase-2